MISACDKCLRRSYLIAYLAPRIAALLERPRRAPAGLLALDERQLIEAVGGRRADVAERALNGLDMAAVRAEIEAAGVDAACHHAGHYPRGFDALADPPAVAYSCGGRRAASLAESTAVAVVGTRRASPYGLEMAYALGRGLGAAGVVVVSGLALGVDAAVHRGCLDGGGMPVAVLAGGADVPYPRSNRALYGQVRDRGLVVAEMPPGRTAFRWSFPARNRLMAALGPMTVVVEAAERSGSLITAEFAEDLGRVVGAVPGRATARMAAGSNSLLRDGARVVLGAQDVLDELFGVEMPAHAPHPFEHGEELDDDLRRVLDAVEAGEGVDEAARSAGMSTRETRVALARLEASGHVIRDRLGSYARGVPG